MDNFTKNYDLLKINLGLKQHLIGKSFHNRLRHLCLHDNIKIVIMEIDTINVDKLGTLIIGIQ